MLAACLQSDVLQLWSRLDKRVDKVVKELFIGPIELSEIIVMYVGREVSVSNVAADCRLRVSALACGLQLIQLTFLESWNQLLGRF